MGCVTHASYRVVPCRCLALCDRRPTWIRALVQYRNLKLSEQSLIRDLFEGYYDPRVYCTESRYFEWLHVLSPARRACAADDEYTVLAAVDGDRLMACICYVPTQVHVAGRRYSAVVTTESLARPEAAGAYGLLARRLVGRFDYCFMMGATPHLRELYVRQLRAHYRHDMTRWLMIGDLSALQLVLSGAPASRTASDDQLSAWAASARRFAAGKRWVKLTRDEALAADYWDARLRGEQACLRRDPAWIEWRYRQHPHIEYDLISVDASQSSGVAVLRREQLSTHDCHAARLLEFLPTPGAEAQLAGAVAAYAVEGRCALLDFFCAHEAWDEWMPREFLRPHQYDPYNIPYLLQPPEWRARRSINLLTTRNRRKRRELPELGGGSIYLTKGDGAQDIALNEGYRSAHLR